MRTAQERDLLKKAEEMGITVQFSHGRIAEDSSVILAKGGRTFCTLHDLSDPDKPVLLASGSARCSGRDTYNKGIGRAIALGRAFKALEASKELV